MPKQLRGNGPKSRNLLAAAQKLRERDATPTPTKLGKVRGNQTGVATAAKTKLVKPKEEEIEKEEKAWLKQKHEHGNFSIKHVLRHRDNFYNTV